MLKVSKLAAAAFGLLLISAAGVASAVEPGYYSDDAGGCNAGSFGVNDYDYNIFASYSFPAMRNGETSFVYGSQYNNYGQYQGVTTAYFSCSDGWVTYSGPYSDGPTWD